MAKWGLQNIKCRSCQNKAVMTYETAYDYIIEPRYAIRYFDRICSVCMHWSAWIWLDNGQIKVTIDA